MLWFVILALTLVVVILICLLSLFVYFYSYKQMSERLYPFVDKEKHDFLLDDEDDVMWSQH